MRCRLSINGEVLPHILIAYVRVFVFMELRNCKNPKIILYGYFKTLKYLLKIFENKMLTLVVKGIGNVPGF